MDKAFLQTSVGYVKHYAKVTWQRYKKLGIWGKVRFLPRSNLPGAMLSPNRLFG